MKKIYLDIISNELKSVQTSQRVNNSKIEIFASHDSFNNKYGIKLDDNFNNLPSVHWLPKVHKRPYRFRFIYSDL